MKVAEEILKRHALSSFYWDNRQIYKEFCTCDSDRISSIKLEVDENHNWVNPFCDWCNSKVVMTKNHKKEEADFSYLWYIMHKHSRRWWD
jgi:hypothetical protein